MAKSTPRLRFDLIVQYIRVRRLPASLDAMVCEASYRRRFQFDIPAKSQVTAHMVGITLPRNAAVLALTVVPDGFPAVMLDLMPAIGGLAHGRALLGSVAVPTTPVPFMLQIVNLSHIREPIRCPSPKKAAGRVARKKT